MDDREHGGLTRGLAGLLARPLGPADWRRAALHVLDWFGCAAAGALSPSGARLISYGRTMPTGGCRAVGGLSLSSRDAALVNGGVGNVLEMDDFYRTAIVHPGPVVIPAALSVSQETGAPAAALLDAVVRGFEAMIRIGRTVGPAHYKFFHSTATCGVFGSAAAAGSLLGLDGERMSDALGNAATQASGLWQCRLEDCMSKQLHNGRAAQSGVIAAQLAAHGFTGARLALEGPLGFYNAMCPDGAPHKLLEEPDGPWLIHGTSFKPWPACRHTHPTIDAALAIRGRIAPAETRRIVVETYRDAVVVCDNPHPRTPVEMKFSLQHAIAVALLRGAPRLEDFDTGAEADPELAALRDRVELAVSDAYTGAYPAHFGAAVWMEPAAGAPAISKVADALGDPENPLPLGALRDKALMLLASAGYRDAAAEGIVGAALALAEGGTLGNLMERLV